ncbi:MAG: hypothetical protein ABL860_05240, partial [Candidatus Nitrotoga sp.]
LGTVQIQQADHALHAEGDYLAEQKMGKIVIEMQGLTQDMAHRAHSRQVTFYQKCFSLAAVTQTLEKTGFGEIEIYDAHQDFPYPEQASPRTIILCRKTRN